MQRTVRPNHLSAQTISTYSAAAQLDAHLAEAGVGTVADIRKAHIEELIANLVATRSAATAHNRDRALQQLFGWLKRRVGAG